MISKELLSKKGNMMEYDYHPFLILDHVFWQTQVAIANHWLGIWTNKTGNMSQPNLFTNPAYYLQESNGSCCFRIWNALEVLEVRAPMVVLSVKHGETLCRTLHHCNAALVAGIISRTETASPLHSIWPPAGQPRKGTAWSSLEVHFDVRNLLIQWNQGFKLGKFGNPLGSRSWGLKVPKEFPPWILGILAVGTPRAFEKRGMWWLRVVWMCPAAGLSEGDVEHLHLLPGIDSEKCSMLRSILDPHQKCEKPRIYWLTCFLLLQTYTHFAVDSAYLRLLLGYFDLLGLQRSFAWDCGTFFVFWGRLRSPRNISHKPMFRLVSSDSFWNWDTLIVYNSPNPFHLS